MESKGHSMRRGANFDRLVIQEQLILEVTEKLIEALGDAGVSRAELARRLGRTPGFVSQVLAGGRNLTLRTVADVAAALSMRPSLALSSEIERVPETTHWLPAEEWTPSPRAPIPFPEFPVSAAGFTACAA